MNSKKKSSCRFCNHPSLTILFRANRGETDKHASQFACTNALFGSHGPIVRCGNCDIIYVDENITQKKIVSYYEVVEDPTYFSEQKARSLTFKNYLKKLNKVFPSKGKLLDVGTFTGLFVKVAKDNGWNATGIEPNKWGVNYAKENYGVTIVNKAFSSNAFPQGSFDVITMWDVIEHFTDPVAEMKKVNQYLKPGGVFAFSTVDPQSLAAKIRGTSWPWYMEMHRVFLTPLAARKYLLESGFKNVVFKPHWRFFSLGYSATRLESIHPIVSKICVTLGNWLSLNGIIVPFYANDLYDCYAFK